MNKKQILTAGKWAAMIFLTGINFLFYSVNKSNLNLLLTFFILGYSVYEFFIFLSNKKLHIGIKMYLFTFFLFAVISLLMGMQSLLKDNFSTVFICLALIVGDIVLIHYSIKKFSQT